MFFEYFICYLVQPGVVEQSLTNYLHQRLIIWGLGRIMQFVCTVIMIMTLLGCLLDFFMENINNKYKYAGLQRTFW